MPISIASARTPALGGAVEDFVAGGAPGAVDVSASVGIDAAYDSNVYNGRGPDEVTRVTPRLALTLHDRRQELKLSYEVGFWEYTLGKAGSSINHRAVADYQVRATRRLTLRVADEFVRAEDPGFLVRAGVVAPQTGILDNIADAQALYRFSRRWDGFTGYSYRTTRFDAQPAGQPALHDGDEHDADVQALAKVTRLDDVHLGVHGQYFTADGSSLAVTGAPMLGWRHQLFRDVELRGEGGPVAYDALAAGGVSGITYRGNALVRWYTPTWRASASYLHDLIGGTGAAQVLWADWAYAQLGYHFGESFDVHTGVGAFRNGLAPSASALYDGVNLDVIADVRVVRNLRMAAYYSYRWQEALAPLDANANLVPVNRSIVGVRLFAVIGAEARPPRREVIP